MTAFRPGFIPSHLSGKVDDFRTEPDGNVSFSHPEAALGLGPEESRKRISPQQYMATFDGKTRSLDMQGALKNQYDPLNAPYQSLSTVLRDRIAGGIRGAASWGTSSQGRSVGTAALLSGLAGGGLGAYMANRSGGSELGNGLLYALLAGAIGAGGTAIAQNQLGKRYGQEKTAASAAVEDIIDAVMGSSMSPGDKSQALQAVAKLQAWQRGELANLLRTASGAAVGVIITRYLGAKGLLPIAAGGILGALISNSSRIGSSLPKINSIGHLSR